MKLLRTIFIYYICVSKGMSNFEGLFGIKNIHDNKIIADLLNIDHNLVPVDKKGQCTIKGVVRHIPNEILPKDCLGIIVNISANSTSKDGNCARWGSDDNTYNIYPTLFKILPRARSICLICDKDGNLKAKFDNQGYSKFLGATSNEEDEQVDVQNNGLFSLKADNSMEARYVFTTKENGKMAVITMFNFRNVNYFFGGSKNEHLVVGESSPEQVNLYKESFATDIFNTWFTKWETLTLEQRTQLRDLMISNDKVGVTLCGEYNDGRHMVPLKNMKYNIVFFGMVKKIMITDEGELCADIVCTVETFIKLGIDTIDLKIFNYPDEKQLIQIRETIRYKTGVEGYVIHKQVLTQNGWRTVSLEKYKTWWYVMIRMLREFIRSKYGLEPEWETRWLKRIDQRDEQYMKLPSDFKDAWYKLTCDYINWFISKKYTKDIIGYMQGSLGMAETWQSFINETGANDNIEARGANELTNTGPQIVSKIVLFLQGTVGLGKSCIGYRATDMLNELGISAVALEQDTFVPQYGLKKAGNACFDKFRSLLKLSDIIILQRNNANPQQYFKYVQEAKVNNFTVVFAYPSEIQDPLAAQLLGLTCMQSTMDRKGHVGLKDCPLSKQLQLVLTFLSQLEVPCRGTYIDIVFGIDYLDINKISNFNIDKEVLESYQDYYEDVAENQWNVKLRHIRDVSTEFKLDSIKYQDLRLPIDAIATFIVDKVLSIWGKPYISISSKIDSVQEIKYIAIVFDQSTKEQLLEIIDDLKLTGIYSSFPNKFLHHITLVYCMDNKQNKKLYQELLGIENKEIEFKITNVIIDENRLMAFECDLGENNILVESKIPHITIATAQNVKPIESVNGVTNKSKHKIYPINGNFIGKISFIR